MNAADVIGLARRRINDPDTDGRWSTADMLDFLSAGCDQLMRDILFPDCRITTPSVPNLQEYQLPDTLEIHAVYLDGRLCVPAPDKDILEGNPTLYYDQRGMGPIPPAGSAGPLANQGSYVPRWTIQSPAAFPTANSFSTMVWPAPTANPWSTGQRPTFYVEGGFIGFVPAPSNGPPVINGVLENNIEIRCALPHEQVVDIEQPLWFPITCRSPLAQYVVAECRFSEATQISTALATQALQRYTKEMSQRRTDAKVFRNAHNMDQPRMITGRQYWQGQIKRVGPF